MKIRILSLSLTLILCLSLFAGCADNAEETTAEVPGKTSESISETITEETQSNYEFNPEIPENNYGKEFLIAVQTSINKLDYHWVERSSNDVLSSAIYSRQEKLYDHLGVEIVAKADNDYVTYVDHCRTAVKNRDDSLHLMLTHNYRGVEILITGGYLADLAAFDGLNLDADYWSKDFMETIAIDDKMFLGNNKFNILCTHVIAYNKQMMEQYADSMSSTVYDLVNAQSWTLDEMIALSKKVSIDKSSDGKTIDDTFGISGIRWIPFCGFLHACDIWLVEPDEQGNYVVSVYNDKNRERTTTLIEKLTELVASEYAWLHYDGTEWSERVQLHTGRTLMELISTNDLSDYCNYEELSFGILPFPKYDAMQESYRHLQWGGYTVIPSYVKDAVMVAETTELLAYYSNDVNTAFYEKVLGKQAADAVEDCEMLELVWNTICTDFGQTFSTDWSSILYMVPTLTAPDSTEGIASYAAKLEKSTNRRLEKLFLSIRKNKSE